MTTYQIRFVRPWNEYACGSIGSFDLATATTLVQERPTIAVEIDPLPNDDQSVVDATLFEPDYDDYLESLSTGST